MRLCNESQSIRHSLRVGAGMSIGGGISTDVPGAITGTSITLPLTGKIGMDVGSIMSGGDPDFSYSPGGAEGIDVSYNLPGAIHYGSPVRLFSPQ